MFECWFDMQWLGFCCLRFVWYGLRCLVFVNFGVSGLIVVIGLWLVLVFSVVAFRVWVVYYCVDVWLVDC